MGMHINFLASLNRSTIVFMAKKKPVTNEKIMEVLLEMDERMTNMDERVTDMSKRMATKDDLADVKEDILKEIRPIARAVDKDAVTILSHEKRITALEKKAALK